MYINTILVLIHYLLQKCGLVYNIVYIWEMSCIWNDGFPSYIKLINLVVVNRWNIMFSLSVGQFIKKRLYM